jgi:hypothetical protein
VTGSRVYYIARYAREPEADNDTDRILTSSAVRWMTMRMSVAPRTGTRAEPVKYIKNLRRFVFGKPSMMLQNLVYKIFGHGSTDKVNKLHLCTTE